MQCAVIEFAQNVLGWEDAHTTEIKNDSSRPVIDIMENQKQITHKGGTMRLGAYDCELSKESKVYEIYNKIKIEERHRHRYEFNNTYLEEFKKAGLIPTGMNPENNLVEIVEIQDHPFFVGVQFHPEYKSTVEEAHPLFVHFVKASLVEKKVEKELLNMP